MGGGEQQTPVCNPRCPGGLLWVQEFEPSLGNRTRHCLINKWIKTIWEVVHTHANTILYKELGDVLRMPREDCTRAESRSGLSVQPVKYQIISAPQCSPPSWSAASYYRWMSLGILNYSLAEISVNNVDCTQLWFVLVRAGRSCKIAFSFLLTFS